MADYSLTANRNWSAIKASLSNGDRIVADGLGAWVLTLDENPTLTGIDFVSAAGAYIALGATATYDLTNWIIRATTNHGVTVASGKTITGPITFHGSTTTADKFGCNLTAGGTITTCTATGGSANGAHGVTLAAGSTITTCTATGGIGNYSNGVVNSGTITTCTATGGSATGAHGAQNYGTITTCTATGGSSSSAYGVYNASTITTCTATGGSVAYGVYNYNTGRILTCTATGGTAANVYGVYNVGVILNCTATGGTNATAYGVYNFTACYAVALTGATGYAVYNTGLLVCDKRALTNALCVNRISGRLIVYGDTNATEPTDNFDGTGGDIVYVPAPANCVSGASVLGESGTYPTTATTQAADQATLDAQKAFLQRPADGGPASIQFGSSTPTTGTLNTAALEAAAAAAQLVTDKAAVTSAKAAVLETTTLLTIAGTLPQAKVMQANGGSIAPADVLTTGTGVGAGGTYVEPVQGDVRPTAWGGTLYGPGGLTEGTLAAMPADLQTIKTQTVTCAAGVTIYPAVGLAAAKLTQLEAAIGTGVVAASGNWSTLAAADIRTAIGMATANLDAQLAALPTAAENAAAYFESGFVHYVFTS